MLGIASLIEAPVVERNNVINLHQAFTPLMDHIGLPTCAPCRGRSTGDLQQMMERDLMGEPMSRGGALFTLDPFTLDPVYMFHPSRQALLLNPVYSSPVQSVTNLRTFAISLRPAKPHKTQDQSSEASLELAHGTTAHAQTSSSSQETLHTVHSHLCGML